MIAAWTPPLRRTASPDGPLRAADEATGPRVAYQGEPGAFGEAAIVRHWGASAVAVSADTFARAIELLLAGRTDRSVIPSWNSSIGPIAGVQALLDEHGARIEVVGEIVMPVHHALLALPGATLDSVRAVGSHHAALGQCAGYLAARPQLTAYEAYDTAGAARELAALVGGAPRGQVRPWYADVPGAAPETLAAIASETAAERHGLIVLERRIQDHRENETRFVVLQRRGEGQQ